MYDSYRIEWRIEPNRNGVPRGGWCCPIEGCDGKGFGFDILPTDPHYRDENGELMWCDDGDEEDQECDDLPEDGKGRPDAERRKYDPDDDVPF